MNHLLFRDIAGQRGAAMVIALLVSVVLLTLGVTFLAVSKTDRTISSNEVGGSRAFNLAEAGIEHAVAEIPDQDVDTLLAAGGALFTNEALGEGTYSVTVSNNLSPDFPTGGIPADSGGATDDTDGYIVVTSTGVMAPAQRAVRVIMQISSGGGPGLFDWAVFSRGELKLTGSTTITGPTGGNAAMKFSGDSPKIIGDATASGTIQNAALNVTGTATEGAPPVSLPDIACPAIPWGPAPIGPSVGLNASGQLSISGGDPTVWPSGTYYFSKFSKSGSGDNVVPLGANVQIYINGRLSISGGSWSNANGDPSMLQFWGCGTSDTSDWSMTGDSTSWMTMYVPHHKIKFTGGGTRYGSFIGAAYENSGPGGVVYDASLQGGGGGATGIVLGSWTEVW